MYNKPKSSLEYSEPVIEQYSDNVVLEVMPQKIDDDTSSKYVLIKHDYYSSDSDHGRELLSGFLDGLSESSFSSVVVYLIDKGTKLLDETNPLHDSMLRLIEKSEMVIAAADSISFYEVTYDSNSKIVEQSSRSIAEDIIYLPGLFVLE